MHNPRLQDDDESECSLSIRMTQEEGVKENYLLTLIILALWTASLLQFTLVLTATKSRRARSALIRAGSTASAMTSGEKSCCPTEVRNKIDRADQGFTC